MPSLGTLLGGPSLFPLRRGRALVLGGAPDPAALLAGLGDERAPLAGVGGVGA